MSLNYNCWMDQHIIKNYWPRRVEKKRAQPKCTAHEFRKEKKRQFSQSTRKRRVACPFHLVYQATYRYIMQPPTRVISLDSALLCSANERYQQHSTFLSIFKVAHQIIVLSLSLELLQVLFRFTDFARSPPKRKMESGFPHLFCAPHILSSVQDRVNIPNIKWASVGNQINGRIYVCFNNL